MAASIFLPGAILWASGVPNVRLVDQELSGVLLMISQDRSRFDRSVGPAQEGQSLLRCVQVVMTGRKKLYEEMSMCVMLNVHTSEPDYSAKPGTGASGCFMWPFPVWHPLQLEQPSSQSGQSACSQGQIAQHTVEYIYTVLYK